MATPTGSLWSAVGGSLASGMGNLGLQMTRNKTNRRHRPRKKGKRTVMTAIRCEEMDNVGLERTLEETSAPIDDAIPISSGSSPVMSEDKLDEENLTQQHKRVPCLILYECLVWMWRYNKKWKKKKLGEENERIILRYISYVKSLMHRLETTLQYTSTNRAWFKHIYDVLDDSLSTSGKDMSPFSHSPVFFRYVLIEKVKISPFKNLEMFKVGDRMCSIMNKIPS